MSFRTVNFMKFWHLKLTFIAALATGCLLRSEKPKDKILPNETNKSRVLLQKELKLVINEIVNKVQEYPRSTNILIENIDEPSESLLINTHEFVKCYGLERFKRDLYLESFPNEKDYEVKTFYSAKRIARITNSVHLTSAKQAKYKIVWFNWNTVAAPGIGKLIHALIGRQFQHATVLIIPKDAQIKVTKKGVPKIIHNGVEIPPTDYFSRHVDIESDPDDFYKDRSNYTTNLKAGQISFEYFEIDSELSQRLEVYESSGSGFRNPYIAYVGREQWDAYQKSKLEFINYIGIDEEKELQKLLSSLAYQDRVLTKADIIESIKKFIVGRPITNKAVEGFAEFWFKRVQIRQFEHVLTELKIIKYYKTFDEKIAEDFRRILDPKRAISYQDFIDFFKDAEIAINPNNRPSEQQFKKFKPLLDHYTSQQNFDRVYESFAKKRRDYSKSYNFLKSNCFTYACNAVNNIGGNAPEKKAYWIPHRINSQLIEQDKNVDIYSVKRMKNGVSIRVSDQLAKDKLNRGRNILAIVGLLAVGVPTTVIFREEIGEQIQDKYDSFRLVADNIANYQKDLESLAIKYVKLSSQLHHLELREQWIIEAGK